MTNMVPTVVKHYLQNKTFTIFSRPAMPGFKTPSHSFLLIVDILHCKRV